MDPSPSSLGRYQLLRQLSSGGMGSVFLARQEGPAGFSKTLAIKQIRAELCADSAFVEMFLEEARLVARLGSHPNIVQVLELGEERGTYFIAMEYIHGRNLRLVAQRLRQLKRPFPWTLAVTLCSQALQGLHHAHELRDERGAPLGVVHRDVSPDNILVGFAGGVKLADFGIAKATAMLGQTLPGTLKGKHGYMAPEQIQRKPLDRRADLYSMGVVLYELLADRRPFVSPDEAALFARVLHEPPAPLSAFRPDLPGEVLALVDQALQKDPAERFATADEMARALEGLVQARRETQTSSLDVRTFMSSLFPEEASSDQSQGPATPHDPGGSSFVGTRPVPLALEPSAHPLAGEPTLSMLPPPPTPRPPRSDRRAVSRAARFGLPLVLPLVALALWRGTRASHPPPPPPPATVVTAPPPPRAEPPASSKEVSTASPQPPPPRERPKASKHGAVRGPPVEASSSVKTGWVTFQVSPWARVLWKGRELGMTPMDPVEVPAGTQVFTLRNEQIGVTRSVTVHVPRGGRIVLRSNLLN